MNLLRTFSLLLILLVGGGCSGATKDQLLQVREYMNRDHVELIMGKPDNVRAIRTIDDTFIICWDYKVAGEPWTVKFCRQGRRSAKTGEFQTLQGTLGGDKNDGGWGQRCEWPLDSVYFND